MSLEIPRIEHKIGEFCPSCKSTDKPMSKIGTLQRRRGKFGSFLGCTMYPSCKYTTPFREDKRSLYDRWGNRK